jgi:hypothetical protein
MIGLATTVAFGSGSPESTVKDNTPRVEGDRLVFSNGSVFHLSTKVTTQARRAATYDVTIVAEWQRVVIIKSEDLAEDTLRELQVYDYDGRLLSPPQLFIGELQILRSTRRLFLAQQTAHSRIEESFLLDQDARLVARLDQPQTIVQASHSFDDRVVWIISNDLRKGSPIAIVEVFDSDGRRLTTLESDRETTIEYRRGKVIYKIHVPQPDFPG